MDNEDLKQDKENISNDDEHSTENQSSEDEIEQKRETNQINKMINNLSYVKRAKFYSNIALKIFKSVLFIFKLIINIIVSAVTPLGITIIIVVFLLYNLFAFMNVYGPIRFDDICGENGAPILENISKEDKAKSIYSYFATNSSISKPVSAYLANLVAKSEYDFDDITGTDCKTSSKHFETCILKELSSNPFKLSQYRVGPFQLKGEMLSHLFKLSRDDDKIWTNSNYQLETVKYFVEEYANVTDSPITDEKRAEEAIQIINEMLGIHASGKEINIALSEANKLVEENSNLITGCIALGTGRGRGRTDGGGARDTGGFGFIDLSSLISFLESYHTSTKIFTQGSHGSESATPEMIEAKMIAEGKGGSDPIPDLYSSCDRAIATGIKALGIDVEYPWGNVSTQRDYMEISSNWVKIDDPCDRQSGDVIVWPGSHVAIFGINSEGVEMVYQASYQEYLPYKSKASSCGPTMYGESVEYWRFVGSTDSLISLENKGE